MPVKSLGCVIIDLTSQKIICDLDCQFAASNFKGSLIEISLIRISKIVRNSKIVIIFRMNYARNF